MKNSTLYNLHQHGEVIAHEGQVLRICATIHHPDKYAAGVAESITPNTNEEATRGSDTAHWLHAIEGELQALYRNNTWSVSQQLTWMKDHSFQVIT